MQQQEQKKRMELETAQTLLKELGAEGAEFQR